MGILTSSPFHLPGTAGWSILSTTSLAGHFHHSGSGCFVLLLKHLRRLQLPVAWILTHQPPLLRSSSHALQTLTSSLCFCCFYHGACPLSELLLLLWPNPGGCRKLQVSTCSSTEYYLPSGYYCWLSPLFNSLGKAGPGLPAI